MADPHELPRFSGPRLPSEENKESEIDPEAFRKVLKVDESEESQKRNKRQRAEEEIEEDEVEEEGEATPEGASFSSFMSDGEDGDSLFDVGDAKGGIKRSTSSSQETQSYSGPQSSYSGKFMGKDQGEEVSDALFENLEQAPPPPPEEEENLFAPPEQEASAPSEPQPTRQSIPEPEPISSDHNVDEPRQVQKPKATDESHTDHSHKEKEKSKEKAKEAKKLEPLDLEAKKTVEDPQNVKKVGEEAHEIVGEKIEEPKAAQKVGKADVKDIEAPHEKKIEDHTIQSDSSDAQDQHPDDDDEKKEKREVHAEGHHDQKDKKKEKEATPGFKEVKEKVEAKNMPTDQVAAAAYEELSTHPIGPTTIVGEEPKVGEKGKGKKKVVSQPDTPVLFSDDGKVETKLQKDNDKNDQQQQQAQVSEIQGGSTPVQGADAPAYSKLNPDVFELFEKMVGLLTIEYGKGVSTTEVKLSLPGSIFDKTKIIMQRFETAPGTFNLQLQGSEEAVNMFSANMGQLAAAFAGSKLAFEVNLRRPELLKEERTVLHRKSQDYHGGEQHKEGK